MSAPAIRIEGLSKVYRLGETHENTFSDRLVQIGRTLFRRRQRERTAPVDFWALRDINLDIREGEAIGIIGGNGAGKSTLLKILSRITPPTTGRAVVRGRLSSLLEVGTGFHPELTGRENVYLNGTILGMRKAEVARKFDEIVAFSGVEQFIDTPVKRYSSGMYVRLAFAVAAHLEPDVLIIDEVLAVGDAEFQKRCLGKMGDVAREGRTVLFVSHNMAAIQKLCSQAVWLKNGHLERVGNPAEVVCDYLESTANTLGDIDGHASGYLYDARHMADAPSTRILSLQLLDESATPVTEAATWAKQVFRIMFELGRDYRSVSVELWLTSTDGVQLLLTSTAPDRTMAISAGSGIHQIDCAFENFPLAAGEYIVGLALAIPRVEYIWRSDSICRLRVAPRDVFDSGFPPAAPRSLVVARHEWTSLAQNIESPYVSSRASDNAASSDGRQSS